MSDPKIGFSIKEIGKAAFEWYGTWNRDVCCLAENRLMKGELPDVLKEPEEVSKVP